MGRLLKFSSALLSLLLMLWLLSVMLFACFQILPGDPVRIMLGPSAEEAQVESERHRLGLDQPLLQRYERSLTQIFDAKDPLMSWRFRQPVQRLIQDRLPTSLGLLALSMLLLIFVSLCLALISAYRIGSKVDRALLFLTRFLISLPSFFSGILIALLFSSVLHIWRPGARLPVSLTLGQYLSVLFLPALAVALPRIAQAYQFLRQSLEKEWRQDYARTAKAKGASRLRILLKHLLRNAWLPYVTALGMIFSEMLLGTLVVEQIFSLNGLGSLLFASVSSRDFPVVQTLILSLSTLIFLVNRGTDAINHAIDPRTRRRGA